MRLANILIGTIAVDIAASLPYITSTGLATVEGRSETPTSLPQASVTVNDTSLVERGSEHVARNTSLSDIETVEDTQQSDVVGRHVA